MFKTGGCLIIGVPNLASLHNRFLLLLGRQPTCIRALGPHVRGYTYSDFKRLIETDRFFKMEDVKGANYYPFSPKIAKKIAMLFPMSSVSIIMKIRRTNKRGTFSDVLDTRFFETNFYKGNGKTIFD